MDTKGILKKFTGCVGVSGLESKAVAYARKLLAPYGKVETTALGSVLCRVREAGPGVPHLLLDAHIDEIGLIVTFVDDTGFLRVSGCGGIDRRLLLASLVTVHAQGGPVKGVVCSVPPHLSDGDDKNNRKVEEIHIDIGYDGARAKQLVRPGDRITFDAQCRELLGGLVSGRAIDDRAGCVALLCALEALNDAEPGCGLTVQFSSLEESGGMGAGTAAYAVEPTHAVAVDVSFGHTPDAPREKCGHIRGGPMVGFAPILSDEMSRTLVRLCEEQKIPYQYEVMSPRTGTNADSIAAVRAGVRTGLVSIPLRYMHMPIETVAVEDIENTGRLLAAYAKTLRGGE